MRHIRMLPLLVLAAVGCKDELTVELHAEEAPAQAADLRPDESMRVFSCRERDAAGLLTVCFEVSLDALGNDLSTVRRAFERCEGFDWQPGNPCPADGVSQSCRGAALEDGVVYDKFIYPPGLINAHPLPPECAENGGNFTDSSNAR